MAATGTEYVTLEQLKDLVTNMIQPLVDAVGSMRKIVPVTCANYNSTLVLLKLADGYSTSSVSMSSGDMMLIVNSEDGTYENGSYLLYTGSGEVELTNSNVAWSKDHLTEYKTAASTVKVPDGVALLSAIEGTGLPIATYQLGVKTSDGTENVSGLIISNNDLSSSSIKDKSTSFASLVAASVENMGVASIGVKAANGTASSTSGISLSKHAEDTVDIDAMVPSIIDPGGKITHLTADRLANAEIFDVVNMSGAMILVDKISV